MTARRPSAREEQLELEVRVLRADLARIRTDLGDYPVTGCGDGSCVVAKPQGMRTNGGCQCDERTLRHALAWWKRRAQFLEETIRTMKMDSGSQLAEWTKGLGQDGE